MAPAAHHGKPHSGAKLDQCYERDLRRTAETHRWTIDANPARRVDRHSRDKVETLHKSPAASGRGNRARNGQPDLTAVTVAGELQEGPMVDHLLCPVRLVPERERASTRRYTSERTLRVRATQQGIVETGDPELARFIAHACCGIAEHLDAAFLQRRRHALRAVGAVVVAQNRQ